MHLYFGTASAIFSIMTMAQSFGWFWPGQSIAESTDNRETPEYKLGFGYAIIPLVVM